MTFPTRLLATLLLAGLSSFVAPAPIKDILPLPKALLGSAVPETMLPRSILPEPILDASTEDIGADAISAGAASTQGDIDDDDLVDDLERLIEILGDHVDHLRGGSDGHDTDDEDEGKDKWGDEGGSSAPEDADQADGHMSADHTTDGYHGDASAGDIAEPRVVNHVPEPAYQGYEPGFVNITCKGISVCNPVTVIGGSKGSKSSHREKGWKQWGKGKWDRLLEKTSRKKAGWRNHWG